MSVSQGRLRQASASPGHVHSPGECHLPPSTLVWKVKEQSAVLFIHEIEETRAPYM